MTLNAPAWLVERPIAHRGLHDREQGVIENTLGAAEAAIARRLRDRMRRSDSAPTARRSSSTTRPSIGF